MLAFQEVQTDRYLLKTERKEPDCIGIYFSYGNPQLPILRGLNFDADSAFIIESTPKQDTLTYWLRDTMLVNKDTLEMSMEYLITDSLGQLVTQLDTLELVAKTPYAKRLKAKQKEIEDWQKEQDKKKKREEPYDSIFPAKPLEIKYEVAQSMDPNRSVFIEAPTPLASLDTAAIHLYSQIDTLWYRAPFEFHRCDSMLRRYELVVDWHPDTEYSLEIDSAAFVDIYGLASKPYKAGIKVKSLDQYSTLQMQLTGLDVKQMIAQLLNGNDQVVQEAPVEDDGSAQFYYINPGTYYMRAFVDRNGNRLWDTGNYDDNLQPEEVYYYPRDIEAKEKFDMTLQWNLTERKLNQQKPGKIIKQQPDKEKKRKKNRNAERARQLGIEYMKRSVNQ
jgi:hypothetical protein